jgi:hypothetical protein
MSPWNWTWYFSNQTNLSSKDTNRPSTIEESSLEQVDVKHVASSDDEVESSAVRQILAEIQKLGLIPDVPEPSTREPPSRCLGFLGLNKSEKKRIAALAVLNKSLANERNNYNSHTLSLEVALDDLIVKYDQAMACSRRAKECVLMDFDLFRDQLQDKIHQSSLAYESTIKVRETYTIS